MVEKEKSYSARSGSTARGRSQTNSGNGTSSKNTPREQTARSEGRAPARTYAIRSHKEASSPDVITVCKDCPLMIKGYYFSANLMLLPFDEFDVILGMDWLIAHDVILNY
ncbi:Retrotransposon protein [Gossypium australe]|uniref:Retrotransposon protein n=1 Tax=Gossypium australe TaxID=47621 RepID=A0A5B6VWI7_9ROSI|nr:Retrotransposon protein [Gossypium australe]